MRPATRIRFALRAALRRRYGYAALRVLRRAVARAVVIHLERPYSGTGVPEELAKEYSRALRVLLRRWPNLDFTDERSRP
jgi:hypothetical protein